MANSGGKSGGNSGHPPYFPPDFPPEFGKPTRIWVKPPEFKIGWGKIGSKIGWVWTLKSRFKNVGPKSGGKSGGTTRLWTRFSQKGVLLQNRVENRMEIMVENRVGDPSFHPILDPILAPQKPRNISSYSSSFLKFVLYLHNEEGIQVFNVLQYACTV